MVVVVCDDERESREQLVNYCKEYGHGLSVSSYSSAFNLLLDADSMPFDIVIMDIEMSAPNGFEVATILRKKKRSPLIIFVTKSNAYTIQGYGIAFRYLPKPFTYEVFTEALTLAIKTISPTKITFLSNGVSHILSTDTILYCETIDHTLTVHTLTDALSSRVTLQEIAGKLSDEDFAQPHKSYLVNLAFVHSVESDCIYVGQRSSLTRIPLSKGKRKTFIRLLGEYVAK